MVKIEAYKFDELPSRDKQIEALMSKKFDILVIGGGATGSAAALVSFVLMLFCFLFVLEIQPNRMQQHVG
jgi:hypothetical protein